MADTTEVPTKSEFILIEWTAMRILHIADPVYLIPGVNRVPTDFWEAHRSDLKDRIVAEGTELSDSEKAAGKIIERFATASTTVVDTPARKGQGGVIAEPARKDLVSEVTAAKDLTDLAPADAAKIIAKTYDVQLLNTYLELSVTESVLAAVRKQLAKIEKENKKEK